MLPLQFPDGVDAETLGLDGTELFDLEGLDIIMPGKSVTLHILRADGRRQMIDLLARIDTALELQWVRAGGILPDALSRYQGTMGT